MSITEPAVPIVEFEAFPKIARLFREVTITEKIDGTNAQIIIDEDGHVFAGSRSRLITPKDDNFGFAAWVDKNADDLRKLGPGRHYGEWWGAGIQRRYGLTERRFSLFNTARWSDDSVRPACCHVVPVLYQGIMHTYAVDNAIQELRALGSKAAPGFMDPEGVIVWHEAARQYFKITCKNDEKPKGSQEAA